MDEVKVESEFKLNTVIILTEPYSVLSQFTYNNNLKRSRKTLSNFIKREGFYVAGRLD